MTQIFLCAGGTGGHLYPAVATARALFFDKGIRDVVVLSDKVIEDDIVQSMLMPLPRRSPRWKLPVFLWGLGRAFVQCLRLFQKTQPHLVVGFGGYASVPAVLAAQFLKIPTLLHEQNAVLGRSNRYLLKRACLVATTFEPTVHIHKAIPHITTGNPVRIRPSTAYAAQKQGGPKTLLILGGSQGASVFSTLIPKALSLLSGQELQNLAVYQQCRSELLCATQKAYEALPPLHHLTLAPFFTDMDALYEQSDGVIARSGASTVSEVTVANRPAYFIPYPYAMDDHQYHNAKILCDKGAAYMARQADVTPENLAHFIRCLIHDAPVLKDMTHALKAYTMHEAASALAQVCEDLLPQED